MKFNKIFVSGAAGFIGFHTVKKLLDNGHKVVGLDNINDYYDVDLKYARLKELGIERKGAEVFKNKTLSTTYDSFTFIRLNLEDRESIKGLFKQEKFDAVIHLAAQAGVRYSLENPEAYVDSNIVGFLTILEGCRHNNVQHLVYASSSSVYGENEKVPFEETDRVDYPVSLYAATKKSNELMAHSYSHLYQIPTTGLRFFTVYGPWGRPDMSPILFADAIIKNEPIKVFNSGEMERDFTYIEDITNGILTILDKIPEEKPAYRILNIGNGAPVNLMNFIETLEYAFDKRAKKCFMPMQAGDVKRTWADTTRIDNLGYFHSKSSLDKNLKMFVEWYKKYYGDE